MKQYQREEKDWRSFFVKLDVILFFVILALELVIFVMLQKSDKIEQTIPVYLREYLFMPTIHNLTFTLAGVLTAKYAKNNLVKNAAPILAITLMFGDVALVHHVFLITMTIFVIPIFMTIFFGNQKLLLIVTGLSLGFLVFIPFYCKIKDSNTAKGAYFYPTMIIAFAVITSVMRIATKLIRILEEQNGRLMLAIEEAKASEEKAIEANKAKSQFLSMASHEIRTPMNAVVGLTDLLLKGEDLNETQRNYLENIRVSGTSLVMIVNDLLDQAKIEAGKMEIVEEPYEIRSMLENIRLIIENRIGEKPISLVYEVDERIPSQMVGDGLRIRQILINLMNNSVKFTEQGHIKVSIRIVEEEDGAAMVRFGISDTGQGIKEEDLSRLFKAFSQVDTRKNHGKEGTGLGLSISSNFIDLMGGQLKVSSEYGKGSEFYFTIRQRLIKNTDDSGESSDTKEFTAPDARVLVVDDTKVNLVVAGGLFGTLGIKIDKADCGQKAIEMILQKEYDLIFMDYLMPELNGVETTKKLKNLSLEYEEQGDSVKAEYLRNLIVLALTGDTSNEAKEQFAAAGMKDFLEKPLELEKLKAAIRKWLPEKIVVLE